MKNACVSNLHEHEVKKLHAAVVQVCSVTWLLRLHGSTARGLFFCVTNEWLALQRFGA